MPPVTEPITYDLDGNILTDGRWTYTWDAENRLTSVTCLAQASPLVPGYRLNFTYDGLSRRIAKKVEQQSTFGGAWSVVEYQSYLYDGWNCIMCVRLNNDATPTTPPTLRGRLASYVWGPDLGSSSVRGGNWQRAGGVGGLPFVSQGTSINTYSGGPDPFYNDSYFPLWDRMGNLTGYRKASTVTTDSALATTGAMLEYDAFGRELRSSGPAADKIPFHFSSKFTDVETGLNYYGYRYYDAANRRWLGRDPIGEEGGENLYGMVRNNSSNSIDIVGLVLLDDGGYPGTRNDPAPLCPQCKSGEIKCEADEPYMEAPEITEANKELREYNKKLQRIMSVGSATPGGIGKVGGALAGGGAVFENGQNGLLPGGPKSVADLAVTLAEINNQSYNQCFAAKGYVNVRKYVCVDGMWNTSQKELVGGFMQAPANGNTPKLFPANQPPSSSELAEMSSMAIKKYAQKNK